MKMEKETLTGWHLGEQDTVYNIKLIWWVVLRSVHLADFSIGSCEVSALLLLIGLPKLAYRKAMKDGNSTRLLMAKESGQLTICFLFTHHVQTCGFKEISMSEFFYYCSCLTKRRLKNL